MIAHGWRSGMFAVIALAFVAAGCTEPYGEPEPYPYPSPSHRGSERISHGGYYGERGGTWRTAPRGSPAEPRMEPYVRGGGERAYSAKSASLRGGFGTFDNMRVLSNGHNDINGMVEELVDLKVNTYNYLIHHTANDWDDLKDFLPLARQHGIDVWVTVVPPSESPPYHDFYSEPFRLDFDRWATEIAELSAKNPNLVAWSIDDFTRNLGYFTPSRLREIRKRAAAINPGLCFVPVAYYKQINREFADRYASLIDGVLFPYRAESDMHANVTDPNECDLEVRRVRGLLGPQVPVIVDVYASFVSHLGQSTPEYARRVIEQGFQEADGVQVFRHPQKGSPQWTVVQQEFSRHAARSGSRTPAPGPAPMPEPEPSPGPAIPPPPRLPPMMP